MFFIDDILLSPMKGLVAICRNIRETAQQELDDQERAIVADLSELHRLLESGQIGDDEFNGRETDLLDRLEEVQKILEPEPSEEPSDS
jgi:hypothetical protein